MKARYLFLLLFIFFNPVWADFSNTQVWHHPLYIGDTEPFLIDLKGEWPTDCHPGEQKPVINEYTGDSVLIEFETIIEHVTCNDVVTPYRVLVDMSDVIDTVEGEFRSILITVRFGGAELEHLLDKRCLMCDPPPPPRDIKPEAGLYESDGLEKQGLLLARQNQRMGVYPLIYAESGSSEWLFGGSGIVEDVYFADLYELTGGQCLGCLPPDEPTELNKVGKFSMLMDSEGLIQVKINDGLFTTYEQGEFGYGTFEIVNLADYTLVKVPDLSGRWAFSENNSDMWGEITTPPTSVLPLVFDVTLRSNVTNPPPPTIGVPPPVIGDPPPPHNVFYSILNMEGEQVAQMLCEYRDEMVCDLKIPEFRDFNESYKVQLLSIERMKMTNTAPNDSHDGVGIGTGTAVRID